MKSEFHWRSVGAVFAAIVIGGLCATVTSIFPVLMKSVTEEFGEQRSAIAGLMTIAAWCGSLATPIAGAALDRWGIRPVLFPITIVSALASIAIGFAPHNNLVILYALFALAGLANCTFAGCFKLVSSWFDLRRGIVFAAMGICTMGIWMVVLPQSARWFSATYGWRAAYMGIGVAALLIVPATVLMLGQERSRHPTFAGQAPITEGVNAADAWRSTTFWLIITAIIALTAMANSVRAHLVAMLTDRGMTQAIAVNVMSVGFFGVIIGECLGGFLLDRFQTPKIAVPFALLSLVGLVILNVGTTPAAWSTGMVVMNIGYSAELGMPAYFFARYFGMRAYGKIYGSLFLCATPLAGLSPFLMGYVYDHYGSYQIMIRTFEVVLVIGAICLWRLGPYRFERRVPRPVQVETPPVTAS